MLFILHLASGHFEGGGLEAAGIGERMAISFPSVEFDLYA